jgi:glycosyltransferase involved in cell wall biosynthesis
VLVDSADTGAVVELVRALLGNADLRRRLGRGGRAAVEEFFNWDRVTADLRRAGEEFGAPSAVA